MFWCDAEKNYCVQFCATRIFQSGGPKAGEGGEAGKAGKARMGWEFPPSPPLPPFGGPVSKTVSALGGRVAGNRSVSEFSWPDVLETPIFYTRNTCSAPDKRYRNEEAEEYV